MASPLQGVRDLSVWRIPGTVWSSITWAQGRLQEPRTNAVHWWYIWHVFYARADGKVPQPTPARSSRADTHVLFKYIIKRGSYCTSITSSGKLLLALKISPCTAFNLSLVWASPKQHLQAHVLCWAVTSSCPSQPYLTSVSSAIPQFLKHCFLLSSPVSLHAALPQIHNFAVVLFYLCIVFIAFIYLFLIFLACVTQRWA